jgi:hypothetical protein
VQLTATTILATGLPHRSRKPANRTPPATEQNLKDPFTAGVFV